jgi:hypothetical protein
MLLSCSKKQRPLPHFSAILNKALKTASPPVLDLCSSIADRIRFDTLRAFASGLSLTIARPRRQHCI